MQQRTGQAAAAAADAASDAGGDRRLKLATYLPEKVVAAFRKAGLTSDLYEWQVPVVVILPPPTEL